MNTINLTFVRLFIELIVLKKNNGLIVLNLVDHIKKIKPSTIDCHYVNRLNLCSDTTSLLIVSVYNFSTKYNQMI